MPADFLIAAAGAAFGAGGAYTIAKATQRQVNGVGRKLNLLRDAVLTYCPKDDETREKIVKFLNP